MKTNVSSPLDLFFDQLRDLHSMEKQILPHLTELAALACDENLGVQLSGHQRETESQLSSIVELFQRHGRDPGGDTCKAIKGLIEGGTAHLEGVGDPATRDLMMIAHCLRIEHYEIAAYEITSRIAGQLGLVDEAGILLGSLEQEQTAAGALLALQPAIFEAANSSRQQPIQNTFNP